ncbi:MAG: c-type cytochrome [Alphaproteobacteria bacterium]|jgi:mono/diheme cytochrome c family protein|nr:c-type cytochrome [Alphaproteobacteria bacterium]|tara:strand:- start:621 stop:1586 length:966 start_codon:yes stop_codon:yes gene_type:complete
MKTPRIGSFLSVVLTLLAVYALVKWGIPALSREVTKLPFPLPVPSTLMFFYMVLTIVALFLFVTFSEEGLDDFLRPVKNFLRGGYTKSLRAVVLTALPALIGWQVYEIAVPKVEVPSALRIQHPSSNFPKSFEAKKNPIASPTEAQVDAFIEQAKANEVDFIPQVREDVEHWADEMGPDHVLEFFPAAAMQELLAQLPSGKVDRATARAALMEKNLFEGRALYAMNCRACHGDSVAGDGPMADGFKLRPINFTDNGTIETIVEGYTFWRVSNGGPGLPNEATPWDSAMPEWKLSLTEEQRWRIILAEYDLAQKTPRIPEGH